MSLKSKILANYASQFYVALLGIVVVPLYFRYLGSEAYGLIGVFTMLQAWFNLLDMGLTLTVAREMARFRGGAISAFRFRQFVRLVEGAFLVMAVVASMALWLGAPTLGARWLNVTQLPTAQVTNAIQLMSVAMALRWMSGLYRGVVVGAERLVWLSGFNAGIATLRFVLVLPLLMFVGATPQVFFGYQIGVAVLELLGLILFSRRLLPSLAVSPSIPWEWASLKPLLGFSLTIAVASSVWVVVTQTDKLLLSKVLTLADYGYFTVAVLAASSIALVGNPISTVILPRMARLQAAGNDADLIALYRRATRMVAVAVAPIVLLLICFPRYVLWAWTGDSHLVEKVAPVLAIYSAGYGILALSAFPFYLQYAKGDLRLHLVGSAFFLCLLIPSLILAATHYGMVGAGWAWLFANAMYFLLWVPLVHRRFAPGVHRVWLLRDVGEPVVLAIVAALGTVALMRWDTNRVALGGELATIGALSFLVVYIIAGRAGLKGAPEA